jgi:phosphoribosylamine---glycine ligase
VGAGAREHALAWKLASSPDLTRLFVLPGNPGMDPLADTIGGIAPSDAGAVAAVAAAQRIDFAVIGPEAPLAAGVVDALRARGIAAFGPSRAAARLESSKSFAKTVMQRAGVPTAVAVTFEDPESAAAHLAASDGPYVVKADGLAAGKGVLVTDDGREARAWVDRCLGGGFGSAGERVIIEEYLDGPELSVFAICDGERYLTMAPARDYKRLQDGDQGPNTGGMGSYSPVEMAPDLLHVVEEKVIEPTLRLMAEDDTPYTGFLYIGLALTSAGPKVIEFNCRLGDPEAQVVLPRLDSDLLPVLRGAADGSLGTSPLSWSTDAAVNVVLAAPGYPDAPETGDAIRGLKEIPTDVLVFHAGTSRRDGAIVTAGGRVLSVVGTGPDLLSARTRAYSAVAVIDFRGRIYRRDIAG